MPWQAGLDPSSDHLLDVPVRQLPGIEVHELRLAPQFAKERGQKTLVVKHRLVRHALVKQRVLVVVLFENRTEDADVVTRADRQAGQITSGFSDALAAVSAGPAGLGVRSVFHQHLVDPPPDSQ